MRSQFSILLIRTIVRSHITSGQLQWKGGGDALVQEVRKQEGLRSCEIGLRYRSQTLQLLALTLSSFLLHSSMYNFLIDDSNENT